MAYDSERTYQGSEWAARRWDWFNDGRVIEPLSSCQFWRTVLVWASIRWALSPFVWLYSLIPDVAIPRPVLQLLALPARVCWFILRNIARGLWRLTYPLRCVAKPVGGAALAGAVKIRQPIADSYQRHKTGADRVIVAVAILFYGGLAAFFIIAAFLASWFWTLIAIGALAAALVVGFACYGFSKSGALRLLWEVAVVVHHGICPPVRIVRDGKGA